MMNLFPDLISMYFLALAAGVTFVSGFVKGAVGFGMPMIIISGLGSFLSPDLALAALIFPTLISNGWQAFRGGARAAVQALTTYRTYIFFLLLFIALSAQLVDLLPASTMLMILGVPVTFFALSQLLGWKLTLHAKNQTRFEIVLGTMAGLVGGISGVWGPATIAYLTALNTSKVEQVRVQGVIYGIGALVLFLSHLKSGVLTLQTMHVSLWMVAPAVLGMALGFQLHDRLDQNRFRKATLLVLTLAGLNLIRRALLA